MLILLKTNNFKYITELAQMQEEIHQIIKQPFTVERIKSITGYKLHIDFFL